jgi:hypothetical protein
MESEELVQAVISHQADVIAATSGRPISAVPRASEPGATR